MARIALSKAYLNFILIGLSAFLQMILVRPTTLSAKPFCGVTTNGLA